MLTSSCVTLGKYPALWVVGAEVVLHESLHQESEEASSKLCYFLNMERWASLSQSQDDISGDVQCAAQMTVHVSPVPKGGSETPMKENVEVMHGTGKDSTHWCPPLLTGGGFPHCRIWDNTQSLGFGYLISLG